MTAERKIVVTAIAPDPFVIWRTKDADIDELKKTIIERGRGEDVFIKDHEGDLDITVVAGSYNQVLEMLGNSWKLDPFFHTSGRPWTVNAGHVWVLVKGTPEEIAELNPFVELPKPEVTEADQRTIDKFAGIIDVVDVTPEALEDGRVKDLTEKGYAVFNILKGSIILVKRKDTAPEKALSAEGIPVEVKAK